MATRFFLLTAFGASVLTCSTAWSQAVITADSVNSATFESWEAAKNAVPVLEVNPRSGEVEVEGTRSAGEAGEPDTAEVAVPGAPDAVVETPEISTDVPDEAAAQMEADPEVREELKQAKDAPDPFLVRVQVLLDRAAASPGEIDGLFGDNTHKAIRAYQSMKGVEPDGEITAALWAALEKDAATPLQTYTLTAEDVDGKYVADLPEDYADLAKLDWIGFRNASEMLAERFHMDEGLLKLLNPEVDFTEPGTEIVVAAVRSPLDIKITRIEVDKAKGELRAYAEDETPVFVAPATIGSEDSPSPSGKVEVLAVVRDPTYTYNPEVNFQQGDNTEKLELAPGPNGPVGNVWIDLSKPTYGIHGTPLPNLIDKSQSHGCVRLTNWDAAFLADMVEPKKTTVAFVDG